MEEWSEDLLERLRAERDRKGRPLRSYEIGPICDVNREWVNDDSGLIAQAHRHCAGAKASYTVMLVSSDRRLGNQMAETCNATVIRLNPQEFVRLSHAEGKEISQGMDPSFLRKHGITCDLILLDTGSISATASAMVDEHGVLYNRVVRDTGWRDEHRFSEVTLTKITKTRLLKEIHKPVTRPKIWRSGSRPHESAYSSHSSWRNSLRSAGSESSWWRRGEFPLTTRSTAKAAASGDMSTQRGIHV